MDGHARFSEIRNSEISVSFLMKNAAISERIDALLAQMTPEEKAGQLCQFFAFTPNDAAISDAIAAGQVGSILVVRDPVELDRLQHIAVEKSRLGIPLLFGFDVIHGLRTIFPVPIAMAASWDMDTIELGQSIAAKEARAIGLHWTFAPMLDIARDPRWGRMVEGAGEDPYLGSAIAAAQVRGFQGREIGTPGHVIAGPKHFAGYGAALGGRDYDEVEISDSELRNIYLPPFKAAIDAGAGNVMCAYMTLNGVPATGNRWLITDVLKQEWGFSGFTVSDANSAYDLATHNFAKDAADAGVRALNAGLDMEMSLTVQSSAYKTLPKSLTDGAIDEATLNDAVCRVLTMKFKMGLFESPYVDQSQINAVLDNPAHRVAARKAAEKSFVLLHNENETLPLKSDALSSIAVIGPLADSARDTLGPWVFDQDLGETVTVLAGIRQKIGNTARIDYSPGVSMIERLNPSFFDALPGFDVAARVEVDDDTEITRAAELARSSDCTVLVLGEAQNMIGEAASRSSLDLPGRQQELLEAVIATGKPVVLLLMAARPIDLKGAQPAAILDIWYPGTQGGAAVASTLFGDAVPGGKLPFNWVRSVGQVPLPYARMKSHQPKERENRYWNEEGSPLYPFGFGLSYASFAYANLRIEKPFVALGDAVRIHVDITNTGGCVADEVAQLYIHQNYGSAARPVRELKGFKRVTIAPGETQTIELILSAQDLTYWSSVSRSWVQDETIFDVMVGGDSNAQLRTTFEVRQ
jgi:beta-glucosidase